MEPLITALPGELTPPASDEGLEEPQTSHSVPTDGREGDRSDVDPQTSPLADEILDSNNEAKLDEEAKDEPEPDDNLEHDLDIPVRKRLVTVAVDDDVCQDTVTGRAAAIAAEAVAAAESEVEKEVSRYVILMGILSDSYSYFSGQSDSHSDSHPHSLVRHTFYPHTYVRATLCVHDYVHIYVRTY